MGGTAKSLESGDAERKHPCHQIIVKQMEIHSCVVWKKKKKVLCEERFFASFVDVLLVPWFCFALGFTCVIKYLVSPHPSPFPLPRPSPSPPPPPLFPWYRFHPAVERGVFLGKSSSSGKNNYSNTNGGTVIVMTITTIVIVRLLQMIVVIIMMVISTLT